MTLLSVARSFYLLLADLSDATGRDARTIWSQLDPKNLTASWAAQGIADQLMASVANAQLAAAEAATPFVSAALIAQGAEAVPLGLLDARTLAGVASDGRDLDDLMLQPLIRALSAIGTGASVPDALELGANALDVIARTQVQDAGRAGVDVAMTTQPTATGYVRMVVPPACGRCAILAGRWYRYSSGFERHPQCNCVHVPSSEDVADDLTTDPDAYFHSLTAAEQDKHFGPAGAQAIRDGANIGQVVNASRGAAGLSQPGRLTAEEQNTLRGGKSRGRLQRVDVFGRQLHVTTEGTTKRGIAGARLIAEGGSQRGTTSRYRRAKIPRLMPSAIAEIAGDDREERIRLLRRFGYVI